MGDFYGKKGNRSRSNYGSDDEFEGRDRTSRNTFDRMDSIADPEKRYILKDCIGSGVCGDVFEAIDQQAGNRRVAVKIQKLTPETQTYIVEEYRVLRDYASHPNLPDFYGIYRRRSGKKTEYDQIWFVMELCEGGCVMDMVRGLVASDRKLRETHIAYILKEVIKAVLHLHENCILHRDIRGSNICLTREGEVRVVDFGLSKAIKGETGKRRTCIGSPCWMAPEVVTSKGGANEGYGGQADVWAIGITAIELAEGKAPFQDIHPTRALFQIVRNPPPVLYRPANWSQNFNDFIAECLEKNPENRPVMAEIMEHPFLSELPENDYPLTQELKSLAKDTVPLGKQDRKPEMIVRKGFLKTHRTDPMEPMFTEDLAALEMLTEDTILDELQQRLKQGYYHSFIGDILLILHPNENQNIYGLHYHAKYNCKSRSDNAPHIYSVADSAYQDVMHNEEPQYIILAGESNSGKTWNMMHLVEHLMFLGKGLQDTGARMMRAIKLIHAFTNAATPLNPNATRCVMQIQTTFGSTGKASAGIFWLYQLEKWRVTTRDKNQSNFHVFYYLYDGLEALAKLKKYGLPHGRRCRYLRIYDKGTERKRSFKVRNDPDGNSGKFNQLKEHFKLLDFEDEQLENIWKILASILLLGEIRFVEGPGGEAEMDHTESADKVAELLNLDTKKFHWALLNYCVIRKGAAVRRKHTCEEAKEARDVLANTIYQRLVDWIINTINVKLSVTRTLFGDKFSVSVLDMFGFECFSVNRIEQLITNTMNEQMQYLYNQRVFTWEMQEQEEDDIPVQQMHFYDNKEAIDQLMNKDHGLFHIIDEASKIQQDVQYIMEQLQQESRSLHIKCVNSHEFTVAHYTGKLVYDASEISEKNRDFLPPEMIETIRLSGNVMTSELFTNRLTKSGNLTIEVEQTKKETVKRSTRSKWGAALVQESTNIRKFNTLSRGQYSQTRKMRTCAATFRAASLEILKNLAVGVGSGGTHFVRCVRSDLEGTPRGFYREVVRQQIRALAILDTAKARQRGFPYRIPFQEFLRRYKFLAFDFDENVEITKDNCRLLLIRLKMEGWMIGKSKVFLKYYNEEYLSRLYETQVKKIIKVQCMMRAFLAKKCLASKVVTVKKEVVKKASLKKKQAASIDSMTEDQAALVLQKAYRGHVVRKEVSPMLKGEDMDEETKDFLRSFSNRWRSKSMYQVLLQYRAARYQDLVALCQQVHLFNQSIVGSIQITNERVPLDKIDPSVLPNAYLGEARPPQVHKLPFDLRREMPDFNTIYKNDPMNFKPRRQGSMMSMVSDDEHEAWDAPLRRHTVPWANSNCRTRDVEVQTTNSPHRSHQRPSSLVNQESTLINTPFSRDPNVPVKCPPEDTNRRNIAGNNFQQSTRGHHSAVSNFSRSKDFDNAGSLRSRKKAPPPPIPFNQQPTRAFNSYNDTTRKNGLDSHNDVDAEDRYNRSSSSKRVNPIHELQMLGRRNNNYDDNEDEPPFNFQAMLRKTSHHRASMKRGENDKFSSPAYRAPRETNVVYRSGGSRGDSPEWSPNEMVRMSEKYGREAGYTENGPRVNITGESITTEIAPGITVEGYVAEL